MLRDATVLDFLLAIGFAGGIAIVYFMTIRQPDRNVATRVVDRWSDIWSEAAWDPPKRFQLWVTAIVASLIAIGALAAFAVAIAKGSLE